MATLTGRFEIKFVEIRDIAIKGTGRNKHILPIWEATVDSDTLASIRSQCENVLILRDMLTNKLLDEEE